MTPSLKTRTYILSYLERRENLGSVIEFTDVPLLNWLV